MEEAGPFRLGGPPDAGWRNPVQPSPRVHESRRSGASLEA